jgi:hypothetical protein
MVPVRLRGPGSLNVISCNEAIQGHFTVHPVKGMPTTGS